MPPRSSAFGFALSLCLTGTGLPGQGTIGIATAIEDRDGDTVIDRLGQRVLIEGTVTTLPYRAIRNDEREYRTYVEDATGGLRIAAPERSVLQQLTPGAKVPLRGVLGQHHGMPFLEVREIAPVSPGEPPRPQQVALAGFDGELLCGRMVTTRGTVEYGADGRLYLNGGPQPVRLFLRPSNSYVPFIARVQPGAVIEVTGVVEQFDETQPFTAAYRIRPRSPRDLRTIPGVPWPWIFGALGGLLLLLVGWLGWRTIRARSRTVTATLAAPQAQRMQALGNLAGGVAHDFNNYLLAIQGYAELARAELDDEAAAVRHLDEVLAASHQAKGLIEQILAFSRQVDRQTEPLDAYEVVREGLRLLRGVLPASITLREVLDPNAGWFLADQGQIHQLLLNLGTNSVHAMPGGGTLAVTLERQSIPSEVARELGLQDAGDYVVLSTEDSGEGMDEATLKRIYEPFFSTRGKSVGTGLGLSVVHGIVQRHDGAIHVESAPGRGTRFRIFFRLHESNRPPAATGADAKRTRLPAPAIEPAAGAGRVLLVDDQENITRLGAEFLRRLGLEADCYHNGEDAARAFEARPDDYRLVLTDFTMPLLTGVELARRVRAARAEVPILLMTGHTDTLPAAELEAVGVVDVIQKPFRLADFGQRIRSALGDGS